LKPDNNHGLELHIVEGVAALDIGQLSELAASCIRETYKPYIPARFLTKEGPAERKRIWQRIRDDANAYSLVAVKNHRPIAFITAKLDNTNPRLFQADIMSLYVLLEYQGLGIGKRLFTDMRKILTVSGCRRAKVGVLKENKSAREFYEKLGCSMQEEVTYDWHGYSVAQCIYSIELSTE
jgi:GNAT superfamily N-acetyltransferase